MTRVFIQAMSRDIQEWLILESMRFEHIRFGSAVF